MATNEYEQPATPGGPLVTIINRTHEVTGTDARLTIRLLVALLAIAVAGSTTPFPWVLVFMAGLVIVCIEVARLAWKK